MRLRVDFRSTEFDCGGIEGEGTHFQEILLSSHLLLNCSSKLQHFIFYELCRVVCNTSTNSFFSIRYFYPSSCILNHANLFLSLPNINDSTRTTTKVAPVDFVRRNPLSIFAINHQAVIKFTPPRHGISFGLRIPTTGAPCRPQWENPMKCWLKNRC